MFASMLNRLWSASSAYVVGIGVAQYEQIDWPTADRVADSVRATLARRARIVDQRIAGRRLSDDAKPSAHVRVAYIVDSDLGTIERSMNGHVPSTMGSFCRRGGGLSPSGPTFFRRVPGFHNRSSFSLRARAPSVFCGG
jgi:hypothetical protein